MLHAASTPHFFIEFAAAVKCLLDLQGSKDSPHFVIHYGQAELVKFAAFLTACEKCQL